MGAYLEYGCASMAVVMEGGARESSRSYIRSSLSRECSAFWCCSSASLSSRVGRSALAC
jgi:hypothetical protein